MDSMMPLCSIVAIGENGAGLGLVASLRFGRIAEVLGVVLLQPRGEGRAADVVQIELALILRGVTRVVLAERADDGGTALIDAPIRWSRCETG